MLGGLQKAVVQTSCLLSDRILGAHVIGPHADELINVFALAMQADIDASQLKHAIFGYPTLGSDMKYML